MNSSIFPITRHISHHLYDRIPAAQEPRTWWYLYQGAHGIVEPWLPEIFQCHHLDDVWNVDVSVPAAGCIRRRSDGGAVSWERASHLPIDLIVILPNDWLVHWPCSKTEYASISKWWRLQLYMKRIFTTGRREFYIPLHENRYCIYDYLNIIQSILFIINLYECECLSVINVTVCVRIP